MSSCSAASEAALCSPLVCLPFLSPLTGLGWEEASPALAVLQRDACHLAGIRTEPGKEAAMFPDIVSLRKFLGEELLSPGLQIIRFDFCIGHIFALQMQPTIIKTLS